MDGKASFEVNRAGVPRSWRMGCASNCQTALVTSTHETRRISKVYFRVSILAKLQLPTQSAAAPSLYMRISRSEIAEEPKDPDTHKTCHARERGRSFVQSRWLYSDRIVKSQNAG